MSLINQRQAMPPRSANFRHTDESLKTFRRSAPRRQAHWRQMIVIQPFLSHMCPTSKLMLFVLVGYSIF